MVLELSLPFTRENCLILPMQEMKFDEQSFRKDKEPILK